MARATFVKRARKDNPVCKKGESYYHWKFAFGAKQYSKTAPSRSQLTQSEFYGTLYELQDQRDEACGNLRDTDGSDFDSFKTIIEDIASQLTDLSSECEGKRDNMPEGLQDSETGQLLETRCDRCQEMEGELSDPLEEWEEDLAPDTDVEVMCPHCNNSESFRYDYEAGTHNCTECEKDYDPTEDIKKRVVERATECEDKIEEIVSNIEGVDLDCE